MPLQNLETDDVNSCFYSGYTLKFFNATRVCSCSNDYYRNAKFLHTIKIDWGIPLFSNESGYGLAKRFTKMKFYQLLNCSLLFILL